MPTVFKPIERGDLTPGYAVHKLTNRSTENWLRCCESSNGLPPRCRLTYRCCQQTKWSSSDREKTTPQTRTREGRGL